MKKKFNKFFLLLLLVVIGLGWVLAKSRLTVFKSSQSIPLELIKEKSTEDISPTTLPSLTKKEIGIRKQTIFLTDWMITNENKIDLSGYCPIVFFGNPTKFNKKNILPGDCQEFFYTLKITDSDFILKENFFEEIKDFGFNGVVIDLEIAGIATDNLVNKINQLIEKLSNQAKENSLKFLIAVYGDTFYRHRPYDINFFVKHSDEIMIMAYDFSKSYGQPGPNFPFSGRDKFGYDFQMMIDDFLKVVPAEKLTVIFGMFGYDWLVDEKKRPITAAKALTLKQIKEKFFKKQDEIGGDDNQRFIQVNCSLANCLAQRDQEAKEMEIDYTFSRDQPDETGIYLIDYHNVWFEDEESVAIKIKFLEEKGIESIAYWSYGYF